MRLILAVSAAWLVVASSAFAGDQLHPPITAFVDVAVVPMDRNEVLPHQTVIVEGERIAHFGPTATVFPPADARRIECAGLFLMPGLVDSHVHLETALGARPEFGDGPLFLAAGVTTVFNLRGSPEQLRWRSEVESGKIIGPNLYTSGEFINEPLEKTPEDVEREVERQVGAGYDLLKLHEIEDQDFNYLTTTGLSRPAYHQLIQSARAHHIPLVGHVPTELGLKAAIAEGQNLAHVVTYIEGYFVPIQSKWFRRLAMVGVGGLVVVIGWCAVSLVAAASRKMLRKEASSIPLIQIRSLALLYGAVILLLSAAYASLEWLGENGRILGITLLAALALGISALLVRRVVSGWRVLAPWNVRTYATLLCLGVALYSSSLLFFVPLSWRSTTPEIRRVIAESKDAHIMVMTTLVVDHASEMADDKELKLLSKTARKDWGVDDGTISQGPGLLQRVLGKHMQWFQQKLVHDLHDDGVPLLLGTDTFGFPGVPPGTSVHQELELLEQSGLPSYDALRTATVNPAQFIGHPNEFGSIVSGARADLLLVQANPLREITTVRQPVGVMVRGRWISRRDLQEMLHSLPE